MTKSTQGENFGDFRNYVLGGNEKNMNCYLKGMIRTNIYINERMFRCLISINIINSRSVLESGYKCK